MTDLVLRGAAADALDALLPRADFVLLTIPHTPATEGLFDTAKFGRMKSTAVLVNIGRGATVQIDALDVALRAGTIGGAALGKNPKHPRFPTSLQYCVSIPANSRDNCGVFRRVRDRAAAGNPSAVGRPELPDDSACCHTR